MADLQHIFTSALDPIGAPTGLGHHHINTATDTAWFSTGTASAADWKRAPDVSSGTGAPATTPLRVGDVYIDTTASAEAAYTAVHTADSTGWSLGGGGGMTGPTLFDDTTYYTMTDVAGTTTITIDDATRYHVITIPAIAVNAGTLAIVLPNSTDFPDADGTNNVEFDIVITSGAFIVGQSGHFDLLTDITIKVNGATQSENSTTYDETVSSNESGINILHESAEATWAFTNVRSYLHMTARNNANNQYMLEVHRDAEAQVPA